MAGFPYPDVLVLHGDRGMRTILRMLLEMAGYTVAAPTWCGALRDDIATRLIEEYEPRLILYGLQSADQEALAHLTATHDRPWLFTVTGAEQLPQSDGLVEINDRLEVAHLTNLVERVRTTLQTGSVVARNGASACPRAPRTRSHIGHGVRTLAS